ncbi:hypothetical protein GUITHDRAFT_148991 [Guillardia theta CCMP2712]|uniref:LysM domain-containing protein n=1 Tax=Guillardia theta (strain CCMP2712) TaxID=905079 RepID=L1I7P5_GUITC|nr:hypothetical protein GUITHDRAFT_148991 [Guillardia theta CCMP2712]EKX31914.1 hypothetical protein GUITHDRAFT_148991 [Guillardia theta CCMP2712]|eukprot:XP_005818894.1 hypothetical protein GUITHDRAFT_148991 [Guillardia theta CCMP2712]
MHLTPVPFSSCLIPLMLLLPVCIGYLCQQRGKELCFSVLVKKCRYCLSIGETIMGAAARYNSDWLQIWGANPAILTPDSVGAWTELRLGPTYITRHGDTLDLLASRFGTSSTNILEANPDVPVVNNTGLLTVGQPICILPRVCWMQAQSGTVGTFTQVL